MCKGIEHAKRASGIERRSGARISRCGCEAVPRPRLGDGPSRESRAIPGDRPRGIITSVEISLVIPAFNEEAYIGECLDTVLALGSGKFKEIVVVDNASTDKTAEVARARPGVVVVREERKGPSNARQTGTEHTTAEIIAFIDADARVHEGWLEMIEKIFRERADVVLLSGPPHFFGLSWIKERIMAFAWWFSAVFVAPFVGYLILGGNCIVRRNAFEAVGGFDRSIPFYGEDTDLAERMSHKGKILFKRDFYIAYSGRRFMREGMVYTTFVYMINYIWHVAFKRPVSKTHTDVR